MNISGNLASEERQGWIRNKLLTEGRVRIGPAADELGVSEMTIRRDLLELESTGLARRVRGGAVAVGPAAFEDRHRQRAKAKATIAEKLLPMVPLTGAIGIDASSTIARLAGSLQAGRDLMVISNGPEVFDALQRKPGVTALLTGGQLDERTGSLVGPLACRGAAHLLLNAFFMSAAGVDPAHGTSEACLEEAEVKRALAQMADQVVLAVDSSKLGSRGIAFGTGWDAISVMVTELDADDRRLEPYRGLVRIL